MAARRGVQHSKAAIEAAAWFFENSVDVFVVVRDGRAERISPSWTNFLGWSEAEAVARPFWDFVHPEDLPVVRAGVKDITDRGEATYEHRILARSGVYFWVRVRAKQSADGAGIVVMQDITEQRRRADEAAEIAGANRLLALAAGVHLWRYDPVSGEYEFDPDFTKPFSETLASHRRPMEMVQGRIDPAELPLVLAAWEQALVTGEPTVIEYRDQRRSGEWRRLRSAWIGARRLACGRHEMIGVTQDLTELMAERDRAQAADRAKAEFLSNVSHEFRTPMNGVMGALHLLRRHRGQADRERVVDQALASAGALSQLLNDIVAFAEAEGGALAVERTAVRVGEPIEAAVGLHRDAAANKGLSLRLIGEGEAAAILDGSKLRQVMGVLVGNAIKFTQTGDVEVEVALEGEGEARRLQVAVRDTGIGVAEADLVGLFARFHQVDGSSTRRFGGAGLGLARARQLAELMGGTITCESRVGEGSTFSLRLPAPDCGLEPEAQVPVTGLAGLRVLVVEDNATNRTVARELLNAFGAEVVTADNGAEGLAQAAQGGFDLVLMDIQMPVMDGIEAARRIRALPAPVGLTPIVALTANVLDHQRRLYAEVGMDGCIAKPITPERLMEELFRLAQPGDRAA